MQGRRSVQDLMSIKELARTPIVGYPQMEGKKEKGSRASTLKNKNRLVEGPKARGRRRSRKKSMLAGEIKGHLARRGGNRHREIRCELRFRLRVRTVARTSLWKHRRKTAHHGKQHTNGRENWRIRRVWCVAFTCRQQRYRG
jgi:hypothetical protein